MVADKLFHLRILTPESILYDGQVSMLSVPGVEGKMVVMHNHESMIVSLKSGAITLQNSAGKCTEMKLVSMATVDVSPGGMYNLSQ